MRASSIFNRLFLSYLLLAVLPFISLAIYFLHDRVEATPDLRFMIYIAAALLLVLSAALSYLIDRKAARPLAELSASAERISRGDLSQRVRLHGRGELARLAASFNKMAEALDLSRQTLESEVSARTTELYESNLRLETSISALRAAESKLLEQASLLDLASDAIIVRNMTSHILFWNQGAEATYGWKADMAIGKVTHQFLLTRFPEPLALIEKKLLSAGQWEGELQHSTRSGERITVTSRWTLKRDDQGDPVSIMEINRDITERKKVEDLMSLYASVFEHSGEAIVITDASNAIMATNEAFHELTGYSQAEVYGKSPSMMYSPRTEPAIYDNMWSELNSKGFWQGEVWDTHKDGHDYPNWLSITAVRNDRNEVTNYIASFSDITEHKANADKISYLAHHDTLTSLPNRFTLIERLEQAFSSARRNREQIAVMFIDLDRFKLINDSLGHHIGDLLLVQVAQRLKSCVRNSDIIARLGGDEFVVGLPELEGVESVFLVADKILTALAAPYAIEGSRLHTSPSIGISLFPSDGDTVEEVMKNADIAMYHAKSSGRNNYQFFEPAMNRAALDRLELENDMRGALENDEFVLYYQPKINIASSRVSGVEALVRWQHPQKGLIPPAMFINIAEETGLMIQLGERVMRQACRQLHQWHAAGISDIMMSINLSARQFRQKNLAQIIAAIIVIENIDPGLVEFEITESMAMDNPQETIETMRMLSSLGVKLAIDDFGTGYSSLSYLKRFPMNSLKLDRSFVKDIETDPSDAAICSATISLAHSLGLDVVAEGVETERQFDYLKKLGCDTIQGYYFSKPLPVEQVEEYVRQRNHPPPPVNDSVVSSKILIVDDDKLVCDFLQHTVEYLGHQPVTALDPLVALEKLEASPEAFSLIMIDMLMPNMSGIDFAMAIRKLAFHVPLVVVTSFKAESVRDAFRPLEKDYNLLYGINYFIMEKPVTIEGVAELVTQILG